MVFFTCNSCGTSLKKNQVERHMGGCGKVVTCIDCHKDFRGQEFVAHTKCISEAEKYNGPGWKPPSSHNKGERKQQAWVETVNAALESGRKSMTPSQVALLKLISSHDNVPRKKAKFMNFLSNVARKGFDQGTIDAVWDAIEAEWKIQAEQKKAEEDASKPETNGGTSDGNGVNDHSTENGEEQEEPSKKKKKKDKKKRKREEMEAEEEEPITNGGAQKKKKKNKGASEDTVEEPQQDENENSIAANSDGEFRWGQIIEKILLSRDDHSISLKKLKKKLFAEYYAVVGDSKGVKSTEDLTSQLNKKLKKRKFKVVGESVKLAVNE